MWSARTGSTVGTTGKDQLKSGQPLKLRKYSELRSHLRMNPEYLEAVDVFHCILPSARIPYGVSLGSFSLFFGGIFSFSESGT